MKETPTGTKEESIWDFLSAFTDGRQEEMKEGCGLKAVSSQTSKNGVRFFIRVVKKIPFP